MNQVAVKLEEVRNIVDDLEDEKQSSTVKKLVRAISLLEDSIDNIRRILSGK